ncbi:YkgJ family cysteine cluster protein [Desulfoscipio geothermicus]|uniref:Putative zinc-or iron-chelating domain-containing protein n=1 Tax=Desulfoscipio geothermicus DSM 3669 TaxID=1121426 RepID=A0A1I6CZ97_9FIRM|nr:YkgJ family cysteine cluster protein [Desulfoscipio geothermicus]SFQ98451.1 Putative zinc-or iron-chelating domain-containing protein [Desulfoscipio geothermicus DSM 3669]
MTEFKDLFQEYELLAAKADQAFQEMQQEHGPCIKCDVRCSDCCNAVFGLFLIESAYLNKHFNALDEGSRREILARADKFEQEFLEMQKRLRELGDDSQKAAAAMARERIRCPLLNDEQKCSLYDHRPITCRVYGIPTIINGKIHACWKAGFEKGKAYPAFNLDGIYKELYRLSTKLLEKAGKNDAERASLLVSVASALKTPGDNMLDGV